MNAPDRLDAIRVPETLPKIIMTVDEKMNNAASYRVHREDHTLGHLLRMELLRDSNVRFAGYKHPHPLENDIVIKIQTASGNQPTQVLSNAARRLEFDFRSLLKDFQDSIKEMGQEAEQIGGS